MTNNIINNNEDFYYHRTENKTCSNSTQHFHSGFELYYMKEGKCHYVINDNSFDIVPGDVILIPSGTIHGTNYGSKPCTRLLLNFPESFISTEILSAVKSMGYIYRNAETIPAINELFFLIEQEYLRNDSLSSSALRAYTEGILMIMIRKSRKVDERRNSIVDAAVKYIQENYTSTIRLAEVAKMLSVSEEHLSRIFKKEITFGFSEYITLIRLQKAEHMLKNEPSRAVTEVAYACGFNDSNYFSYKFKKAYGVTPSEVRDGRENEIPQPPNYIN